VTNLIGNEIHGYEFRERIGSGGFGEVYRAYQPSVDREVAIKVIQTEYAKQPDFVARFEAEARTVAKLEHPHIVPLYDFWHGPEGAFLIMRYLRGGSLRAKLESEGAQNPEEIGRILDQICSALATAHREKVVHRDIKPENILMDEQGEAYLTDFGIAKDLSADFRTKTGSFMGSLAYIAPEQVLGGAVSPAADIYALGILLFELLTGKHPFAGLTQVQLLQRQLERPLPLLAEIQPGLPAECDELIQQATVKDPLERRLDAVSFAASFSDMALFPPYPESAGTPEFLKRDAAAPRPGAGGFCNWRSWKGKDSPRIRVRAPIPAALS
jgi:serine/threonine-protein kinase